MRLRWTPEAFLELQDLIAFIAARNPMAAARVHARIRQSIERLIEFPESAQRTNDPDIRRLVVHPYPYFVLYEVVGGEIVIHRVRDARRRPLST